MDYVQINAYSTNVVYSTSIRLSILKQMPGYKSALRYQKCYLLMGNFYKALFQWKKLNYSLSIESHHSNDKRDVQHHE